MALICYNNNVNKKCQFFSYVIVLTNKQYVLNDNRLFKELLAFGNI